MNDTLILDLIAMVVEEVQIKTIGISQEIFLDSYRPEAIFRNSDPEGKVLYDKYTDAVKKSEDSNLRLTALTMISTGTVPEKMQPKPEVTSQVTTSAGRF